MHNLKENRSMSGQEKATVDKPVQHSTFTDNRDYGSTAGETERQMERDGEWRERKTYSVQWPQ